jgi:thioredoxin-related protein
MEKFKFFMALLLCFILFSPVAQAQVGGRLIVFTTEFCPYCKAFMREVGGVYHKTEAGKLFPLTQVDNSKPPEEFRRMVKKIHFFPTLLVLDDQGRELVRYRGYIGEEFFWGEIESLVRKLKAKNRPQMMVKE